MRNFFIQLIEIGSMALSHPEELAMYLQQEHSGNRYIFVFFGLISLSNATAIYHIRNSYDAGFMIFIPLVAVICFVLVSCWAFLAGAGLDVIIKLRYPDKPVKTLNTIRITALSLLPFIFMLPMAVPAQYFSYKGLFLLVSAFLLLVWHFKNLFNSIRYQYEIENKETIVSCLTIATIVTIFPIVLLLFTLVEFAALMS